MDEPRLNIFYKAIGKRSKGIYFYIVVALIFMLFNNSCYKKVEGNTKTDDTSFVTLDSEIDYKIISDVAYRIIGQKQHPIEGIELREYCTENIRWYFIFDEDSEGKLENEKEGTYFFDSKGDLATIFPKGKTYESYGVYLSYNEKYIGVDSGTYTVRSMTFYSFPDGEKIGSILYRGEVHWFNDSVFYTAVVDTLDHKSSTIKWMNLEYYYYIEEYNVATGIKKTIINYTPLKDYYLKDLIIDREITFILDVSSVEKDEDWVGGAGVKYSTEIWQYDPDLERTVMVRQEARSD
jgi:hypothetical protein